jgi:hypothetical protein
MEHLTPQQQDAIRKLQTVSRIIIDAVEQAGSLGYPGGQLYAALMTLGCTIQQFDAIMDALVHCGKLRKAGHCYFANVPARERN